MKRLIGFLILGLFSQSWSQTPSALEILKKVDEDLTSDRKIVKSKMIVHGRRGSRTIIATIILPVEDENEASDIAESLKRDVNREGNLRLSFAHNGKTYSYGFKKGMDGLILE